MTQVYNLDLETMLFTLSRRQLSGNLTADISKGRGKKELIHIEITVESGKVLSCLLQSNQIQLRDERALESIAQLGMIPWSFSVSPRQSIGEQARPVLALKVATQAGTPVRLVNLQSENLAKLPRTHFQVYAYVDGRRTVEEIAHLLRTTPQQIEDVLFELQAWRVVQYR